MQIQNTRRTPTLHYTKDRTPSPKIKNCFVLDLYRGFYRHKGVLEDETSPRIENRHVGPPNCRGISAFAAFSRQNQGVKSLVLARNVSWLRGPSCYIRFWVYSSGSSSDVRKGLGSMHLLDVPLLGL